MTKGKIGKFIELTPESIDEIVAASGKEPGSKGSLVGGVRNLIDYWLINGRPDIEKVIEDDSKTPLICESDEEHRELENALNHGYSGNVGNH